MSVALRPVVSAPASARRLVRRAGIGWGLPARVVDDAALVAGAFVLGSVRQARSPLTLSVLASDQTILVEVEDTCTAFPIDGRGEGFGTLGFGLATAQRVADACGFTRRPGGRQMWARVSGAGSFATSDSSSGEGGLRSVPTAGAVSASGPNREGRGAG